MDISADWRLVLTTSYLHPFYILIFTLPTYISFLENMLIVGKECSDVDSNQGNTQFSAILLTSLF